MKKYSALFLIALMAVSVVSTVGVVSAAPKTAKTLDTPQLLSPANGAQIPAGEDMIVTWAPVRRATSYVLEITVTFSDGTSGSASANVGDVTTYNFGASGTYEHAKMEWRVMAVCSADAGAHGTWAGVPSAWSDPFTFYFYDFSY